MAVNLGVIVLLEATVPLGRKGRGEEEKWLDRE